MKLKTHGLKIPLDFIVLTFVFVLFFVRAELIDLLLCARLSILRFGNPRRIVLKMICYFLLLFLCNLFSAGRRARSFAINKRSRSVVIPREFFETKAQFNGERRRREIAQKSINLVQFEIIKCLWLLGKS